MCGTKNSALSQRPKRALKNIIITTNINTRSKKPRVRHQSTSAMNKCSSPAASSKNQRKSEGNLKQVGCNWKRADFNSKPAASSLKPPAVEAQKRLLPRVREHHRLLQKSSRRINTMITRRNLKQSICSIVAAGFCAGCASTNPPPLPPGNAADPQISGRTRTPPNVLARDETTLAIANELGQTENTAKSSEGMQHEGMQHDGMQGMQPEGVKMEEHAEAKHGGAMESHEGMQHGAAAQPEKKAVADEMKKTSDEMKKTSEETEVG